MPLQPGTRTGHWIDTSIPGDAPQTIALLVGISRYPHLIGGTDPVVENWGLGNLDVCALTAHQIFDWLRSDYVGPPLGQVWLHLEPTDKEIAHSPGVVEHAGRCRFADLRTAVRDWRDALRTIADGASKASHGLVFCSGHGINFTDAHQLLVPSDWPEGSVTELLSLQNLQLGMYDVGVPLTFFIDACRTAPSGLRAQVLQPSPILTPVAPANIRSDRYQAVFHATDVGSAAWTPTQPEHGPSVFGRALLDGLRGHPNLELDDDQALAHAAVRHDPLHAYVKTRVAELLTKMGHASVPQPVKLTADPEPHVVTLVPAPPAEPATDPEHMPIQAVGVGPATDLPLPRSMVEIEEELHRDTGWRLDLHLSPSLGAGSKLWAEIAPEGLRASFHEHRPNRSSILLAEASGMGLRRNQRTLGELRARWLSDPMGPEEYPHEWTEDLLRHRAGATLLSSGQPVAFHVSDVRAHERDFVVRATFRRDSHEPVLLRLADAATLLFGPEDTVFQLEAKLTSPFSSVEWFQASIHQDSPGRMGEMGRLWTAWSDFSAGKARAMARGAWRGAIQGLYENVEHPEAATIAAAVLTAGREFEPIHSWLGNLSEWFPIPDGTVFWARQIMERRTPQPSQDPTADAIVALERLLDRGLPWTNEGMAQLDWILAMLEGHPSPGLHRIRDAYYAVLPHLRQGALFATFGEKLDPTYLKAVP